MTMATCHVPPEARTGRETLGQLVSLHTVLNDKGVEILHGSDSTKQKPTLLHLTLNLVSPLAFFLILITTPSLQSHHHSREASFLLVVVIKSRTSLISLGYTTVMTTIPLWATQTRPDATEEDRNTYHSIIYTEYTIFVGEQVMGVVYGRIPWIGILLTLMPRRDIPPSPFSLAPYPVFTPFMHP